MPFFMSAFLALFVKLWELWQIFWFWCFFQCIEIVPNLWTCPYLSFTNFSQNSFISFFWFFVLEGSIRAKNWKSPNFQEKISLCPNRPKTVQNPLKMDFFNIRVKSGENWFIKKNFILAQIGPKFNFLILFLVL